MAFPGHQSPLYISLPYPLHKQHKADVLDMWSKHKWMSPPGLWVSLASLRASQKPWGFCFVERRSGWEGARLPSHSSAVYTRSWSLFPSLPHSDRNISLVSFNILLNHLKCKKWTNRSDSTLATLLLVVQLSRAVKTNRRNVEVGVLLPTCSLVSSSCLSPILSTPLLALLWASWNSVFFPQGLNLGNAMFINRCLLFMSDQ
jgi:hypothetical protein